MKILIADDHELFLRGLEFTLNENIKNINISTAQDYSEIFTYLDKNENFDLIITDLAMPGGNWLSSINQIHKLQPDTPIIIISAVFNKEILQQTLDIGVSGYIPKTATNNLMMSAINLVLAGGVYIPHELLYSNKHIKEEANDTIKSLESLTKIHTETTQKGLTDRQIEIVSCIAQGLSNKEIATKLNLTEGTVKVHITIILKILNVKNRTSAVIEATKRGYLNENK